MGLFDKNKENEKDKQIMELQNKIIELQQQIHPDLLTLENVKKQYIEYNAKIQQQKDGYIKNKEILKKVEDLIIEKKKELQALDKQLVKTNEELIVQSFGIYTPTYKLMQSSKYKNDMNKVRDLEKKLIKEDKATTSISSWTVNGSTKEGTKMVKDTTKLLLRNFNLESDDIIDKVNASNYQQSLDRIDKAAEQISKLGVTMKIAITKDYITCKKKECVLAFNYALAKEEEKEELRRIREEEKERAKVQKEIEEQKKKMAKEEQHYNKALLELQKEIQKAKDDNLRLIDLLNKQKELEEALNKVTEEKNSIDFREAHVKAGYVYIISNIGSFGENIYKIGCTRRLDPQERVDELGSASVPFKFDVHALIFSEDAFDLENKLHKAFDDRKVNLENPRKEFFYVTLDEIKEVVNKNFDKTVDFIDVAEAAQYRATLKKREMMKKGIKFDFDNNLEESIDDLD